MLVSCDICANSLIRSNLTIEEGLEMLVEETRAKSSLSQRRDILPVSKEAVWDSITNIVNTFGHLSTDFNKEKSGKRITTVESDTKTGCV